MKIDRTLFLVLTGTLAAAACGTSNPPPTSTPAPSAAPLPAASAAPVTTASATPEPSASTPPVASVVPPPVASSASPALPAPSPPLVFGDPAVVKPVGGERGCGKGKRHYDDTRTSCDDTTVPMPDCSTIEMGYASNEVCPGPVFAKRRCDVATTNFKPAVAQAVHACLGKTTGKYCNSCNMFQCNYNALQGACPDPGSDAACDAIAKSCKGFDRTHCRSYLSGMSDRGRENMVKCLTDSCGKGFLTCLQNLPDHP
jgi:hypothetical protein